MASVANEKIMEVKEKSPRLSCAEKLAEFINQNGLANPYGGEVNRGIDRKNRAYYAVSFSALANIDGVVSVYSPKYFVVKFTTRYKFLPANTTVLFKHHEDLFAFIKAAFVDLNGEAAQVLIEKARIEQ